MTIKLQPNGIGSFYPLSTSPFPITCMVSTTAPVNTVLSGSGKNNAVAGNVAHFIVTLFDSGNNQRTSGGDVLQVAITSTSHSLTQIEIFDNEDGTYNVDYLATDASETYTISVTVNGDSANAKTSTVIVVANIPDPTKSTLAAISPIQIDVAQTYTI